VEAAARRAADDSIASKCIKCANHAMQLDTACWPLSALDSLCAAACKLNPACLGCFLLRAVVCTHTHRHQVPCQQLTQSLVADDNLGQQVTSSCAQTTDQSPPAGHGYQASKEYSVIVQTAAHYKQHSLGCQGTCITCIVDHHKEATSDASSRTQQSQNSRPLVKQAHGCRNQRADLDHSL
jgi:hypothetical protein